MSCRSCSSLPRTIKATTSYARSLHTTSKLLEEPFYNPWRYHKRHLEREAIVPNPLPRLFAQRVVLSDGSTFTSYSTAPSPEILRTARDVTNNALWAPGFEKRGVEDEDGRVGRFKRKFENMSFGDDGTNNTGTENAGAAAEDLSWMSEGGREEKAPAVKLAAKGSGKGKKK